MTDSLPQWEAKRTDLFRQLAAVGDFPARLDHCHFWGVRQTQLSLRQAR
jgi:hypothetical protein